MPLNLEELNSDSNAVITRVSRWLDMFDEIRASKPCTEDSQSLDPNPLANEMEHWIITS